MNSRVGYLIVNNVSLSHTYSHYDLLLVWNLIVLFVVSLSADDDSDTSPHDLEMGSDVEYNNINLSLASHLGGGTHSFTHMQVREIVRYDGIQ